MKRSELTPKQLAAARASDKKTRNRPERKASMKNYLATYSKTDRYREWDNARYDKRKSRIVSRMRERVYGLSEATFEALLYVQEYRCAICGSEFTGESRETKESVDHCHDTNVVRGLLCQICNLAEGYVKKTGLTPEAWGRRAAHYLAAPPMRNAELLA